MIRRWGSEARVRPALPYIAGVLGLMVGVFGAFVAEYFEGEGVISKQSGEFVHGQTGVTDNLAQCAFGDGFAWVNGNDGPSPIRVAIGGMATGLPDALEAHGLKDFDNLARFDRGELVNH